MSTTVFAMNITDYLSVNERKNELVTFLKELKNECGMLSKEQIVIILGQWFHPLHYFPTFLSRLISVSPRLKRRLSSRVFSGKNSAKAIRAARMKTFT